MAGREPELTPELILGAYASGIFPMAETRDDPELFWVDPTFRGIFPLNGFHISKSLRRRLLSAVYTVTLNANFAEVVTGCASRDETWISQRIEGIYAELSQSGFAHSVEVWEGPHLVGGVYGIAIGGAFFGESMFSRRVDASKVALAYLVDHLNFAGYTLFDTQFLTDHLATLGAVEIPRDDYHNLLEKALEQDADFGRVRADVSAQDVVQRNNQIS